MASKPNNPKLPEGFQSPFNRIPMEDRNSDSLACVATLTGRSLSDVQKLAVQLGLPAYGPYFVDGAMIAKMLMNLSGLVATNYKEFTSYAALPDVALLLVDYDENTELGRHVVWHHVRANGGQQSFSYLIDVADWIEPKEYITTALTDFEPAYYIEVTQRPAPKGK